MFRWIDIFDPDVSMDRHFRSRCFDGSTFSIPMFRWIDIGVMDVIFSKSLARDAGFPPASRASGRRAPSSSARSRLDLRVNLDMFGFPAM
jgi:hypothetical protein